MSYCIGSLNLRGGKEAEKHQRDFYDFIYKVVIRENLVLFAFQEDARKEDKSIIETLLGHRFRRESGSKVTALAQRGWEGFHMRGPDSSSEFSFIWNAKRVQPCTVPGKFRNVPPVEMKREPLCGDFAAGGNISFPYEFRLINIHLWHGGGKENRMLECGYVKNEIYEEIQSRIPEKCKHVFTVALGDYNLECNDCDACSSENIRTFQDLETTVKRVEPFGYKNSYDHFSFDIEKNKSVKTEITRIDISKYCRNEEFYINNISDHVPIKIEIF